MRNGRIRQTLTLNTLAPLTLVAIVGCQTSKPDDLALGHQALRQRDYSGAVTSLDAYLQKNPNGPKSAEALYLKGHALQDARNEDQNEAAGRLQQARLAYIDALKVGTDSRGLEGLIRASLADAAFWQEDYATAAEQGRAAYDLLEDPAVRAMALYRAGLSYQRLGRFDDGDRVLGLVVKYHPGTAPATRAQQRLGVRAFNVSIPFGTAAAANGAVAALTRQGFAVAPPAAGETAVNVGPFNTYREATAARAKLNTAYPKAQVMP